MFVPKEISNFFKTGFFKMYVRNIKSFKNNFVFKEQFEKELKKMKINNLSKEGGREIGVKTKNNRKSCDVKQLHFSPLQYKGEVLFGIHPVFLALSKQRRKFHQLFIRNESEGENSWRYKHILELAEALRVPVRNVNTQGLKYLAPGAVHQGVCLDASPYPVSVWKEEKDKFEIVETNVLPLHLVLDEIIDPMNVGAILRSAYYFGVSKIFVIKGNSCKLSPTVSKASSGALEISDIHQIENLEHFIKIRKCKHWNIISTLAYCEDKNITTKVLDASQFVMKGSTVLILGNENRGVSSLIQSLCDTFISISPFQSLHQGVDSLNVSVAAGVILHSLSKSWKESLK